MWKHLTTEQVQSTNSSLDAHNEGKLQLIPVENISERLKVDWGWNEESKYGVE